MNHNDPNTNHADVDRQIREALDVEAPAAQLDRLERFWHAQSRAVRRRQFVRRTAGWAAAVAAVILVGSIISLHQYQQIKEKNDVAIHNDRHIDPVEDNPKPELKDVVTDEVAAAPSKGEDDSLSAGRPPTPYERLFFAARSRHPISVMSPSVPVKKLPPADDKINTLIAQVIHEPEKDVRCLVLESGLAEPRVEPRLLQELRDSNEPRRRAVVRLLAVCGTQRSIPSLLNLAHQNNFRDEALSSIEQIVGPGSMVELLSQIDDRHLRAAMLRRALWNDSEVALRDYLLLVHDKATRVEALAVVDTVSGPLLDRLLQLLQDEKKSVRLSAAIVLGHANGPQVASALIDLVTQQPANSDEDARRTEAWIALIGCQSQQTGKFLAYAAYQPQLLKHFNRARVRLERMTFSSL